MKTATLFCQTPLLSFQALCQCWTARKNWSRTRQMRREDRGPAWINPLAIRSPNERTLDCWGREGTWKTIFYPM